MSSRTQTTQIPARFVCVYASRTLPFIAVFNRFSRCCDHCIYFNRLQNTGVLELNYFVFETIIYAAFLSRLQGPFDNSS